MQRASCVRWCKRLRNASVNLRIQSVWRINSIWGEKRQIAKVSTCEDIFFLKLGVFFLKARVCFRFNVCMCVL